jgi:copper chaperone CopZ
MMIKRYLLLILCFYSFAAFAQTETFTASFITLGNCSICKSRIENAVNMGPGIISVSWDIPSEVTTVAYYCDSTDLYAIMHTIANVGHDTEWFPAPDSAYNLLIGTCCEYTRTIDYSQVQVGYLSLMGIWIFPLGQQEIPKDVSFSVYPNPVQDFLSVKIEQDQNKPFIATIYSLTGAIVYSARITGTGILDLGSLASGEFLITIVSEGVLIGRKKLIKHY